MRVKLKDIGTIITGKTPSTKNKKFWDGNVCFITIEDMNNNLFISNTKRKITDTGLKSLGNNTISETSILVNCVGNIGAVGITQLTCATNQQINSITNIKDICNPLFLYYKLQTMQKVFEKAAGQTILKILPKTVFENIEIDLPDRKTQDKIAEILSGIDEQINRNNEIVKKLQVLAQTTYSRWFNQFEFPNEDGLPYKSNGGKMVWNDELKREIPENWSTKMLGDLLTKNTKKLQDYNDIPTIDLSVMQSDNIALGELNTSNNFSTNLFVMHKGDLMFGSIRPYLHKAGIAPCDGAFAGTVHSYKPIDNIDYNVCLSALISNDIFSFAVKNAKGTKMPVITSDDLLRYKIPYNKSVSRQFTELLDIENIVCNCMMQNNILTELKKSILPLLINGQLKI